MVDSLQAERCQLWESWHLWVCEIIVKFDAVCYKFVWCKEEGAHVGLPGKEGHTRGRAPT